MSDIPATVSGAMESIIISRWHWPDDDDGIEKITLYIDWTRTDGSHGQRFQHFGWNGTDCPAQQLHVFWSECFTAIAFAPQDDPPSVIPILCEVFFCHQPTRKQITAHLRVGKNTFELPISQYQHHENVKETT